MTINPLWLIPVAIVLALLWRAVRGKMDVLAEHARDLVRHLLAAVLMTGTLAGTTSTFSNGQITLAGWQERLVSVVGIALALEVGAIYAGWFLGVLDERISRARRELLAELRTRRRYVRIWFYVVAGISGVANLIFRVPQLHNFFLAAFVSACPVALIVLFMVILRPLPQDHREKARQVAGRAMVQLVSQSEHIIMRAIRRIGGGHAMTDAEREAVRFGVALLAAYTPNAEGQALSFGLQAQPDATAAQTYLTSAQLVTMYAIPRRTAQDWIAKCPDTIPTPAGRGRAAAFASIRLAHGEPLAALPAPDSQPNTQPTRRRKGAQADAFETQVVDADTQSGAEYAQTA